MLLAPVLKLTCTGVKAYWMPPSNRPVEPKTIYEMDLSSPKRKCLDENPVRIRDEEKIDIPSLSEKEKTHLLSNLMEASGTVLHLVTKPFSKRIRDNIDKRKDFHIMSFYKEDFEQKSLTELRQIAEQINITLRLEDCEAIEIETKTQSKCKAWFVFRRGRITASKFKRCCRTNVENPSISLIKEICYPTIHRYKIKALDYGCQHEKAAFKDFSLKMAKTHQNFKIEKMGLCINPKYPYFGASPDGIICCDCCGMALLEIKCPYCAKDSGVRDLINKKSFMEMIGNNVSIKRDHEYYYQIQMQLALTEQEHSYLIVWSKKDFTYIKVQFDELFWLEKSEEAKKFFQKVILPEVLGKYYTKLKNVPDEETVNKDEDLEYFSDIDVYEEVVSAEKKELTLTKDTTVKSVNVCDESGPSTVIQSENILSEPGPSKPILYCICQKEDDHVTPMIACESKDCDIVWYHLKCVGLSNIPETIWICDTCNE